MFLETKREGEAQTKAAQPLTLRGLVAWLETRDPATRYDWSDCRGGCLVGQYYLHLFGADIFHWRRVDERPLLSAPFGDNELYFHIAASEPHTFGAALARAREAMGS